jgi:hypothetical protein
VLKAPPHGTRCLSLASHGRAPSPAHAAHRQHSSQAHAVPPRSPPGAATAPLLRLPRGRLVVGSPAPEPRRTQIPASASFPPLDSSLPIGGGRRNEALLGGSSGAPSSEIEGESTDPAHRPPPPACVPATRVSGLRGWGLPLVLPPRERLSRLPPVPPRSGRNLWCGTAPYSIDT